MFKLENDSQTNEILIAGKAEKGLHWFWAHAKC